MAGPRNQTPENGSTLHSDRGRPLSVTHSRPHVTTHSAHTWKQGAARYLQGYAYSLKIVSLSYSRSLGRITGASTGRAVMAHTADGCLPWLGCGVVGSTHSLDAAPTSSLCLLLNEQHGTQLTHRKQRRRPAYVTLYRIRDVACFFSNQLLVSGHDGAGLRRETCFIDVNPLKAGENWLQNERRHVGGSVVGVVGCVVSTV